MFHSIVLSSPDPAQLPKEELIAPHGSWIDVRDIALAHALVLSNKEAGGERFIISAGGFTWQHCCKSLQRLCLDFTRELELIPVARYK